MVTSPGPAGTGAHLKDREAGDVVMDPSLPALMAPSPCLMETGEMVSGGVYQSVSVLLRSTPPCPGGDKPRTCADGSDPERLRGGPRDERREKRRQNRKGGRRGNRRGRCSRDEKICCDGSTPSYDGDRSTPPCADGNRPK